MPGPCTQLAPTFWTQKRLSRIRTQVYSGSGTAYNEVEWWTLRHTYLQAGGNEGEPMWLAGLTRTGKVTTAGGGEVSDPEIVFDPGAEALSNRVDGSSSDGRSDLFRYRINTITTETGAQIAVSYSGPECTGSNLPQAHNNTKRCYPQWYGPKGEEPTLDWFHKYRVTRVDVYDNTGGFAHEQTNFDYLDTPAWRYDDSELIDEKKRTWSKFRGYGEVRVRKGLESGVQSATEYLYLRGMDGDKQKSSGTKDVWVTDSQGRQVEDHEAFAGMLLEEKTLLGPGGALVSGIISTPVVQGPTATSGPLKAWMPNTGTVRARVPLSDGTTRWTKTVATFNSDNLPTRVDDLGDESTADDDVCTRTEYARNATIWMLDKPKKVEKVGVNCDATPSLPTDLLSSKRITYDSENNDWNSYLPVIGDAAKVEEVDRWEGATPIWLTTARSTFDANGRVTAAYDALGRGSTTSYTPPTAGPVTSTTTTNAAGHTATTSYATSWHLPTLTVDNANGFQTEQTYDGLGRPLKVWRPGRAKATYPNVPDLEFVYRVRNNAPTAVTTKRLTPYGSSTYLTAVALYDGLLRQRQTQTQAPGGGRTLTDTVYDSRGLVAWASNPYYDTTNAAPDTTLVAGPGTPGVPAITENVYDGAGRITSAIFKVNGNERWRTTTSYGGDRTLVTPPEGGTKTETVVNARGLTSELRQYHSRAATTFDTTSYGYNDRGELTTVVDAADNTWSYRYDQRGRKTRDEDPDKGVTTYVYDAAGQLTSSTDANGATLAYTYDDLGRKTSVRNGSVTGPKRAEWVYDTVTRGVGKLTKSIRYEPPGSTNQYVNEVTAYDAGGRPTATRLTIPASEGSLCAAGGATPCVYGYTATYRQNGDLSTSTLPAAGGLPGETLLTSYNQVGLVAGLLTAEQIYAANTYNKLGQVQQRLLGEDGRHTWVTYTIDPHTGRLTNANTIPELKPEVSNFTYGYDHVGNVTKIDDQPVNGSRDTQCYQYDHARRLTEAWTPASGDCETAPTLEGLDGPAPYWRSYEYVGTPGKAGNRTKEIWHGVPDTVRTYHYPAQGGAAGTRPHAVDRVETTGATPNTETYTYDAAGNTRTRPVGVNGQTLTWGAEGRLTQASDSTGTTSYVYDADGNRLIRRDPAGSTLYLPDGTEVRVPNGSAATASRYYAIAGALVAVRTVTGLHWLVADHHGTAEVTISNADLSVSRRRTLPFGESRGGITGTWPAAMDKGFVGGTVDNTGLTHLGAREYDPKLGRFISVDPIMDLADPQQWNGYSYSNNNPATFSDPSGLVHFEDAWGGGETAPGSSGSGGGNSGSSGGSSGGSSPGKTTVDETKYYKLTISDDGQIYLNSYPVPAGGPHVLDLASYLREFCGLSEAQCAMAFYNCDIGFCADAYADQGATATLLSICDMGHCRQSFRNKVAGDNNLLSGLTTTLYGDIGTGASGIYRIGGPLARSTYAKQLSACRSSFAAGTPVLMADGTTKPIEDVEVGDEVVATDPETGETAAKMVIDTIARTGTKNLVRVELDTDGDRGTATADVEATDEHPFWNAARKRWTNAEDLTPGDRLRSADGTLLAVLATKSYTIDTTVYNLTISDIHTYYVLAGNTPVLVHNDSSNPWSNSREWTQGRIPTSGGPENGVLYRRGAGGAIVDWGVYNERGNLRYRVDLFGAAHGGVETPHWQPYRENTNPKTGRVFVQETGEAFSGPGPVGGPPCGF